MLRSELTDLRNEGKRPAHVRKEEENKRRKRNKKNRKETKKNCIRARRPIK